MVWDKRLSVWEEPAALKWKQEQPVGPQGKNMFAAGAAQKAPVRFAGGTYSLCSRWKMGAQFPSQAGSFSHSSA